MAVNAPSLLRLAARKVVDLALPPRCPGCGAITAEPHSFCMTCWGALRFLGRPCCEMCALPFAHEEGEGALCGGCMKRPPRFDRMRAAVAYGEIARKVVLRLKYGGRPGVAETVARFMARHVDAAAAPVLVPVPLHRWRIWRRGYNQSALIARALARRHGLEVQLDLIERVKPTPPLKAMSPRQREETVRGAFRIADGRREALRGRHVLLIDDVYTSGATVSACARLLKRAGAARVDVLCWARVIRGGTD